MLTFDCLLCRCETLSSNPSTRRRRKKKEDEEKRKLI
jgi:hypothetical protein